MTSRTYDITIDQGPGVIVTVPPDSEMASFSASYELVESVSPTALLGRNVRVMRIDITFVDLPEEVNAPVHPSRLGVIRPVQEGP